MLAITVDLLHGTIRAGSADDLGLTGADDPGDWPPSPARLFAALVAGGGTGADSLVGNGGELRLLEAAPPPLVYADAREDVFGSPLAERYVVVDALVKDSNVQEYPSRLATLVRPGTRLCPLRPRVVYEWDGLDLDAPDFSRLEARARRVGYFGCSDSPARVSVARELPDSRSPSVWVPSPEGEALLPVPYVGLLDDLDLAFARWSDGEPVRRAWMPPAMARYAAPGHRATEPSSAREVVAFRFAAPIPGRLVRIVTGTFKAAVLSLYQQRVCGPGEEPPAILHGHGFEQTSGYDLAWWIGLHDVGGPHARGRLMGAALVLPPATPPPVLEGIRAALWHLSELRLPGGRPIRVIPYAGERRPWAIVPRRWTGPSRRWVSVTPVVHERRRKHGPAREDVEAWCAHAGFPAPARFVTSPVPLVGGALALRPSDLYRADDSPRPYSHLELVFDESVTGPMSLGRMRQLGIGLMVPVREEAS